MSDFFREVDEELRRSRIEDFWKKYSVVVIGVAVAVVLATAGYRIWQYYSTKQAEAAGARFEQALVLAREGKGEDAEKVLADVARDAPSGYRILARMRLAGETGKRDAEAGARAFRELAAESGVGPVLQDLARLRAIMLSIGNMPPAAAVSELEPLAADGRPWRAEARELLALVALRAGDLDKAGQWFDRILVDPETPAGLRQRVQQLSGLVAGGKVKVGD